MRLSDESRQIIRKTVAGIFGEDASVLLFGSRIDDTARGGDIDLLVQSTSIIVDRERKVLQLVAKLQIALGDQPIDVIVLDPQVSPQAVHEEALRTGVRL